LRGLTLNTPKPRSSMRSPFASERFILPKTVSTASSALVFVIPVLLTTSLMISSLITGVPQAMESLRLHQVVDAKGDMRYCQPRAYLIAEISVLPPCSPPYLPGDPEETQALLLGWLASACSLNAAKEALQKMGLSGSPQELDRAAIGLVEEPDLRNSRPIDPHLLAVFLDGQYIANAVEAGNRQLEILRRNSGGYFQSEESLKLKLSLVVSVWP
jgi:hypothetical protein